MRAMRKSESCLKRSAKLLEHINKKASIPPIKQPTIAAKKGAIKAQRDTGLLAQQNRRWDSI